MEDELIPPDVRIHKLETRFPKKRLVEHINDDGNQESWRSDKEPVGSGGQGRVFLQRRVSGLGIGALRAVKVIPLQDEGRKKHYIRELRILIRFSHPRYSRYFIQSLGWYLSENELCIAMEYMEKGDLETYLRDKPPLPEAECRQIIWQVMKGLEFMHRLGYAHRDVKPQNVLIQQCPVEGTLHGWWVKLTDFGISKLLETATTGPCTIIGTPSYMAPELLGLGALEVSGTDSTADISYPAADMWALGIMTYRVIMGTILFSTYREISQYCHNPDLKFSHSRLEDRITTDGSAFIKALLAPQVPLRPSSMAALSHRWIQPSASIIQAAVIVDSDTETSSTSSGRSSRSSSFYEERGMTTIVSEATNPPNQPSPAKEGSPARSYVHGADVTLVSHEYLAVPKTVELRHGIEPTPEDQDNLGAGSRGPTTAAHPLPGDGTTASNNTAAKKFRNLTLNGHSRRINSLVFSHDSKLLASGSYDTTVRVWDTTTWQCCQILEGHKTAVKSVAFSNDSRWLATVSKDNILHVWDTTTWKRQAVFKDLKDYGWTAKPVAFSPDSRILAAKSSHRSIRLWDTTTWKRLKTLKDSSWTLHSVAFSNDSKLITVVSGENPLGLWQRPNSIKLWDTTTWQLLKTIDYPVGIRPVVSFSPNGKFLGLAYPSLDPVTDTSILRVYDTDTWQWQETTVQSSKDVESVAFSHNSNVLAVGLRDKTLRLWKRAECRGVTKWKRLKILEGHTAAVTSVAFSSSGLLASGSNTNDATIRIWVGCWTQHMRPREEQGAYEESKVERAKEDVRWKRNSGRSVYWLST